MPWEKWGVRGSVRRDVRGSDLGFVASFSSMVWLNILLNDFSLQISDI